MFASLKRLSSEMVALSKPTCKNSAKIGMRVNFIIFPCNHSNFLLIWYRYSHHYCKSIRLCWHSRLFFFLAAISQYVLRCHQCHPMSIRTASFPLLLCFQWRARINFGTMSTFGFLFWCLSIFVLFFAASSNVKTHSFWSAQSCINSFLCADTYAHTIQLQL